MMGPCQGLCCSRFTMTEPYITQYDDMLVFIEEINGTKSFTCRHWDPETYQCAIYESRPKMCRDYPEGWVGNACWVEGCNFVEDTEYIEE